MIHNRQGPFLGIIILIVTGGAENFCIAPEGDGVYEKAGLGIVEAGRPEESAGKVSYKDLKRKTNNSS